MTKSSKNTTLLYLAAVVFIVWGILGMLDVKNYTTAGFSSNNNEITKVEAGGPAEAAGMKVGDRILKNGGIDVDNSKALSERDRPAIGENRTYTVDRDGEEMDLELTFDAQSAKDRNLNMIGTILGFFFIIIGLLTFRKLKNNLSYAYALFAVLFGFLFTNGPYIAAGTLSNIVNSIDGTLAFMAFAFMTIFVYKYPPKSKAIASEGGYRRMFYPAIITILFLWYLNIFQPDNNPTLNTAIQLIVAVTIIFYFGAALVVLIRKYAKATQEDRSALGLNYMLYGVVLGLLPILISFTLAQVAPKLIIPGNDYVFLTFVFIPIFFTMALKQQAKSK